MSDCPHCDKTFDTDHDRDLHLADHADDLTSHERQQLKRAQRTEESRRDRRAQRRQQWMRRGIYAAVLLLGMGVVAAIGSQFVSVSKTAPSGSLAGADLSDQPLLGAPDASVTVTVFADYRCPYCAVFETQVLPRLASNYIDTGKANLRFINFPFLGPGSTQAAVAAECVYKQEKPEFWDFHRALYEAQGPEHKRWVSTDLLVSLAEQHTEVDTGQLRTCIDEQRTLPAVKDDRAIGEDAGVTGTPAVYIDGEPVENWRYRNLASIIDEKIE